MRDRSLRKPISGLLVLAFVLFGLGQGAEILHSLEEERHLPHHAHQGTVYHESLPCDSGEHHSHFCLHSQQSTTALEYGHQFNQLSLESPPRMRFESFQGFESALHAIRAPPSSA